jgi:hypothetical protein
LAAEVGRPVEQNQSALLVKFIYEYQLMNIEASSSKMPEAGRFA